LDIFGSGKNIKVREFYTIKSGLKFNFFGLLGEIFLTFSPFFTIIKDLQKILLFLEKQFLFANY
jgi:hypothetical protein